MATNKWVSAAVLVLAVGAVAQQLQDVVRFKDGRVVRGMVMEEVPGGDIKIQTADRSLFVYKMSEVSGIAKEGMVARPVPRAQPREAVAPNPPPSTADSVREAPPPKVEECPSFLERSRKYAKEDKAPFSADFGLARESSVKGEDGNHAVSIADLSARLWCRIGERDAVGAGLLLEGNEVRPYAKDKYQFDLGLALDGRRSFSVASKLDLYAQAGLAWFPFCDWQGWGLAMRTEGGAIYRIADDLSARAGFGADLPLWDGLRYGVVASVIWSPSFLQFNRDVK